MLLTLAAWGVGTGLVLFALVQWLVVIHYLRFMQPQSTGQSDVQSTVPSDVPSTVQATVQSIVPGTADACAVVIALRGADPRLLTNLTGHLQQLQVNHHVHFVVDSVDDPVVPLLNRLPAELRHRWTLHVLRLESDTASLKCLGLAQVVRELLHRSDPPDYFAFADGDGEVSRDWLKRLLDPMLTNSSTDSPALAIGATTGHRWYSCFPSSTADEDAATSHLFGGIVRYFWNLGSLPQMHLYHVVWGGSWAVRRQVLAHGGLLESWDKALFEDTQVSTWVAAAGYRVVTARGLLVRSYESVGVVAATRWIARQLLDMRLYHPCFPLTACHAIISLGLQLLAAAVVVAGVSLGRWEVVTGTVAAAAVYQAVYLLSWWQLQQMADRCLANLSFDSAVDPANRWTWSRSWRASIGLLLTQLCYPLATLLACRMPHVTWRGIRYRVRGPQQIQRINYHVYGSSTPSLDAQESK